MSLVQIDRSQHGEEAYYEDYERWGFLLWLGVENSKYKLRKNQVSVTEHDGRYMTKPPSTTTVQNAIVGPSAYVTLAVPIIALIAALLSGSLLLLNYVHVLTAATWTGIDLFMGLVMSRVMRSLSPQSRAEIIKKLVPIMLFFMPALASVAITAGIYLTSRLGLSFFSTPIIIAIIIVAILSVQGFGLILPNEVRVLLELRKANPNTEKVVKLGMRNIYFSGSQAIFQIAIIFVMAYLAVV